MLDPEKVEIAMRILEKSSWMLVLFGLGFCGASCSSETDASGGAGGLQCGEGTVAEGGYCVPMDASVDSASGGSAGAGGTGGVAGAGGGGTGGSPPDAGVDAQDASVEAAEDAPETTVPCMGKCGDPGCGACPTIPVVSAQMPDPGNGAIDAYGIDAFETTVAEYQVFLVANVPKQTDEACEWNNTYEPNPVVFDFPYPDMPIHGVDWCDARAYCEWAGKRLCKGSFSSVEDAQKSEWYNACTLGGTMTYPYGDSFDPDRCPWLQAPYSPGAVQTCEGAYAGLFDMVGNVAEWTDACMKNQPPGITRCVVRGPGYGTSNTSWIACSGGSGVLHETFRAVGIRCCEDL